MAAVSLSDSPGRFDSLKKVLIDGVEHAIEEVWWHGDKLVFKFAGVDSISSAEKLAGRDVSIPASERAPLEDGSFYLSDLVGCEITGRSTGRRIGMVTGWQEYGGPPLLEVRDERGQELLIPFAKSICVKIDPAARRIEVELPEGLLELNDPGQGAP